MFVQRQATSLLLATPPCLRAEIARRAFSTHPVLAHCALLHNSNQATSSHYGGSRILARGIHRSPLLSADTTPSTVPPISAIVEQQPTAQSSSSTSPQPPSQSLLRQLLTAASVVFICFSAGFAMSAAPAADTINGFVNPPSDVETLTLFEPQTPTAAEIDRHIITHPLAAKLRARGDMTESRPHLKIPQAMRPHNLTGGTLLGPDKIEVPPLTFADKNAELPTLTQFSYVGPALCGHPGIVHGGLLATLLDEGLARTCFPALPNKVGVTASLKIDYRVPCPANSYIVLKAHTTKVEGRKAWVTGWIELLGEGDGEGTKLVEAEALFIEPRNAQHMARVYSSQ